MPKFRKRPAVIEAHQWFKNGDHPEGDAAWRARFTRNLEPRRSEPLAIRSSPFNWRHGMSRHASMGTSQRVSR